MKTRTFIFSILIVLASNTNAGLSEWWGKLVSPKEIYLVDGSFSDLYPKPFYKTTGGKAAIIGGSAVVIGAITYFTAGGGLASAGPISTWVGTQVGMASGVGSGATSAGLAILGGGTIASGGLGIAGGLAVISAVSDIAIAIAIEGATTPLPTEKASTKYSLFKIAVPYKVGNDGLKKILSDAEEIRERILESDALSSGDALLLKKRYRQAIDSLGFIDESSKTAGYDYLIKAILHFNFMEYEKSRLALEKAEKFVQNNSFVSYLKALLELTSNNGNSMRLANLYLDQSIALEPSAINPYILKSMILMDEGMPLNAYLAIRDSEDHVEDNFELNWRGAEIAFHNLKDYTSARQLYKEALSNTMLNELESQSKLMIAITYYRENEKEEAKDWFADAIDEIKDEPRLVEMNVELWKNCIDNTSCSARR